MSCQRQAVRGVNLYFYFRHLFTVFFPHCWLGKAIASHMSPLIHTVTPGTSFNPTATNLSLDTCEVVELTLFLPNQLVGQDTSLDSHTVNAAD